MGQHTIHAVGTGQGVGVGANHTLTRPCRDLGITSVGNQNIRVITINGPQAQDDYDIVAQVTADYRNYGPVAALTQPLHGATSEWTPLDAGRAGLQTAWFNLSRTILNHAPLTPLLLSLAVFAVDPASGRLTPAGHVPLAGLQETAFPRHFAIDSSGEWLLVANQHGHNVAAFRVDEETGVPEFAGAVDITTPMHILF